MPLKWTDEIVSPRGQALKWFEPASNVLLDFHGDPLEADLVVFSDGNHHMALLPALQAFRDAHPQVKEVFYATTPPGPLVSLLKQGRLRLGNFTLSVRPHVFLSPPRVLDQLREESCVGEHKLLARNQGSVLLVRRGNPKQISGVADLARPEVRLFISNPETERVSYAGYRQSLEAMAGLQGPALDAFAAAVFGETAVWGRRIHHREAPEAVAAGTADAAVVYYHLALRYTRLFADTFDFIPLGGTKARPAPPSENRVAAIHAALVDEGGLWGRPLLSFLLSRKAADIYAEHGLRHALDL
ncbi:MAG: substrate-binding domain-containing protein [Desulfosarcinaceae bacterium]